MLDDLECSFCQLSQTYIASWELTIRERTIRHIYIRKVAVDETVILIHRAGSFPVTTRNTSYY